MQRVGRTSVFLASWIQKYAPDAAEAIAAGTLKLKPTYDRLRREYLACIAGAVRARPNRQGVRLVVARRDGRSLFEWVPVPG
jgi:hypothetical protein